MWSYIIQPLATRFFFSKSMYIYVVEEFVCVFPCSDTGLGWVDFAMLCIVMVNQMGDFELIDCFQQNST
jgi:hypothetical protein